jgi:hypothetical protein
MDEEWLTLREKKRIFTPYDILSLRKIITRFHLCVLSSHLSPLKSLDARSISAYLARNSRFGQSTHPTTEKEEHS